MIRSIRLIVVATRLVVGAMILAAVIATFADTAARAPVDPANFFGYFTVQSNLIAAAVLLVGAVRMLRGIDSAAFVVIRACSATYLVVVGLVYAVLLAPLGVAGGVPLPWANVVLHIVSPIWIVLDWLLAPDRRRLPFRTLPTVLVYPLVWSAVVLARGATDGWVPYPFLSPENGYGVVAGYVLAIAVVTIAVGAAVWAAARWPSPFGVPSNARSVDPGRRS